MACENRLLGMAAGRLKDLRTIDNDDNVIGATVFRAAQKRFAFATADAN
jgi:hypothetical protein